jgi:hypothetical protein
VEGKEIIMDDINQTAVKNVDIEAEIQALQTQKNIIAKRILSAQGGVNLYDTDIIPRAKEYADNSVGTKAEKQYASWLSSREAEREKYVQEIVDLEKQLADLDAKIVELQK